MPETIEPPDLHLPTKLIDGLDVPILGQPYSRILAELEAGGEFEMSDYHAQGFCGTSHCIAGWLTHLCGLQGLRLEQRVILNDGEFAAAPAARLILAASSQLEIPSFSPDSYVSEEEKACEEEEKCYRLVNSRALAAIRELAAAEREGVT